MSNYEEFSTDHISRADVCFAHRPTSVVSLQRGCWLVELNPAVLLKCMFGKEGVLIILWSRDILHHRFRLKAYSLQETE